VNTSGFISDIADPVISVTPVALSYCADEGADERSTLYKNELQFPYGTDQFLYGAVVIVGLEETYHVIN